MPAGLDKAEKRSWSVARGEQMTVGIWLRNNYGKDITVTPRTWPLQGATNGDTLPQDAIEVRMQRWRDRIALRDHVQEQNDPLWKDRNNNGSLDRNDFEIAYSYQVPGQPDTWQEQWRRSDPSDPTPDVVFYRDPEPLPLYRRGGAIKEGFTIPEDESRLIWVVITIPEDMTSGWYGPTNNSPGLAFDIEGQDFSDYSPIGLAIHVPCWDLISERASSLPLWDYSNLPGTAIVENSGIYLGNLSDRRAEVRMMGGSNTAVATIGWPSRDTNGALTNQWGWIFAGLRSELFRYQPELNQSVDPLPPFNERRIQTLVFGLSSYHDTLLGGVWGPDPLNPSTAWVDRFTDMWDDMHAGLLLQNLNPDDYKIVIIPVDEPTDGVIPVEEPEEGVVSSCPPEQAVQTCGTAMACFVPKYTDVGSTTIETTVLFQHAASIIRTATASWNQPPLILVNHDSPNRTNCDELLTDYEFGGQSGGPPNFVDIWMSAKWMDDALPVPHPLSTVSHTSTDEFWWYFFDTDDVSDLGPMRHAQSGLLMHDNGYSGHANWAFWAAEPEVGPGVPYVANGANTEYNVHSWVTTHPRFWKKDNSVYFADHIPAWDLDGDDTLEASDASASFEIPDGELMIPGRVTLARRQALEHHMLLKHLRNGITGPNGQYYLTTGSETDLYDLILDATDPCHDLGDCPVSYPTPDHVSAVMHQWLTRGYAEFDTCSIPQLTGHKVPTSVKEAFNEEHPWSQP